jgi:hypothetical protein
MDCFVSCDLLMSTDNKVVVVPLCLDGSDTMFVAPLGRSVDTPLVVRCF